MPCPKVFISHATEADLFDGSAIGSAANPFAARLSAWKSLDLYSLISDLTCLEWCGWQHTTNGPESQPGIVLQISAKEHDLPADAVLRTDDQWTRVADRVWICTSDRLIPESLLRHNRRNLPTHTVTLGDGSRWEIPRIRRPMSQGYLLPPELHLSELPHRVRHDWSGQLRMDPVPQYQPLWQASLRVCCALMGEDVALPWTELLSFALDVIGLRYRLTAHLHAAFPDLLNSETLWEVASAACGFDLIECELQKKRRPAELVS